MQQHDPRNDAGAAAKVVQAIGIAGLVAISACQWSSSQGAHEAGASAAGGAGGVLGGDGSHAEVHAVSSRGPWGTLEHKTMVIEPPRDYVQPASCVTTASAWRFPERDRVGVGAFLTQAGMGRADVAALVNGAACDPRGCTVTPPPVLVAAMSPEVRGAVYRELGRWPMNFDQVNPFVRRRHEVAGWMAGLRLSPAVEATLGKLIYFESDLALFADAPIVCRLASPDEGVRLMRGLGGTVAQAATLVVPEGADVDALVRYWGRGREQEARNVRAIFTAAAQTAGGLRLSIFEVLPRLARERLNTYPDPSEGDLNCYWATLNFFAERPDARWVAPAVAQAQLGSAYREIRAGEAAFGDVVVFENDRGEILHAAVYVADGLVFTKNGKTMHRPFVLMRLDDLSTVYALTSRARVLRALPAVAP